MSEHVELTKPDVRSLLTINVATILFALVPTIIRKLPNVSAGQMTFGRAIFGVLGLGAILFFRGENPLALKRPRDAALLLLDGLAITGNWFFYIRAVQVSSIAVAVVSMFTYPLMTTLVEPLLTRSRYRAADIVGGLLVVAGVAIINEHWSRGSSVGLGILFGVSAGACVTTVSLVNRKLIRDYRATQILFVQMSIVSILCCASVARHPETFNDVGVVFKLAILGIALTTFPHILFARSLRKLRASVVTTALSTQPLYTILLGWLIVHEKPTMRVVYSALLISAAVLLVSLAHAKPRQPELVLAPGE